MLSKKIWLIVSFLGILPLHGMVQEKNATNECDTYAPRAVVSCPVLRLPTSKEIPIQQVVSTPAIPVASERAELEPISPEASHELELALVGRRDRERLSLSAQSSIESVSSLCTPPQSSPKTMMSPSLAPKVHFLQSLARYSNCDCTRQECEKPCDCTEKRMEKLEELIDATAKYAQFSPFDAQEKFCLLIRTLVQRYGIETDILKLLSFLNNFAPDAFRKLAHELLETQLAALLLKSLEDPALFAKLAGTALASHELVDRALLAFLDPINHENKHALAIFTKKAGMLHEYYEKVLVPLIEKYLNSSPDAYIIIVDLAYSPRPAVYDEAIRCLSDYCMRVSTPIGIQRDIIKRIVTEGRERSQIALFYNCNFLNEQFKRNNYFFGLCFLWRCLGRMVMSKEAEDTSEKSGIKTNALRLSRAVKNTVFPWILRYFDLTLSENFAALMGMNWRHFLENTLRKAITQGGKDACRQAVQIIAYGEQSNLVRTKSDERPLIDEDFLHTVRSDVLFPKELIIPALGTITESDISNKERTLLFDDFLYTYIYKYKNDPKKLKEFIDELPKSRLKEYALLVLRALGTDLETFDNCTARAELAKLYVQGLSFSSVPRCLCDSQGCLPQACDNYPYINDCIIHPRIVGKRLYGFYQEDCYVQLSCYDLTTNLLVWRHSEKLFTSDDVPLLFVVDKNNIYASRRYGIVEVFDNTTGAYLHDMSLESANSITGLTCTPDGTLYIAQRNSITAYDCLQDREMFTYPLNEDIIYWHRAGEKIAIVTQSATHMRVFDKNGKEDVVKPSFIPAEPTYGNENYYYAILTDNNGTRVHFATLDNSAPAWEYKVDGKLFNPLQVPTDGLLISTMQKLVLLDCKQRKVRWEIPHPVENAEFIIGAYALSDIEPDLLYVVNSRSNDLYHIHLKQGTLTWIRKLNHGTRNAQLFGISRGNLFFTVTPSKRVMFTEPKQVS